jgi:organic radical activating enzyme
MIGGKVTSSRVEINVAEHCNLSCKGCSHLSPIASKQFLHPPALLADLQVLARAYHVTEARLLGGEPLLHPDLLAVVGAVRASGVADRVCIVSNGLLLARMDTQLWQAIDRIELSLYPGRTPGDAQMERIRELAAAHGVALVESRVEKFRVPYTEVVTTDPALVHRIYQSCKIVHEWNCVTVANGRVYRCPQSYFLPKLLPDKFDDPEVDSLALSEDEDFGLRLQKFLRSPAPLVSCTHCLGTVGRLEQHVQIRRDKFRDPQSQPARTLISRAQMNPRRYRSGRRGPGNPVRRAVGRLRRLTSLR